jgi:hypothetical protein
MITRAIENAFRHAREKGWSKTYWAFDVHGTLLKPNNRRDVISTEFYPHAIEVMQMLTRRSDIIKILYTCSYPSEIDQYLELFRANGIHFHYVNTNPEIADGGYGYYKEKFYFNVLFEDKAGFSGEDDWPDVKRVLEKYL